MHTDRQFGILNGTFIQANNQIEPDNPCLLFPNFWVHMTHGGACACGKVPSPVHFLKNEEREMVVFVQETRRSTSLIGLFVY